MLRRILLIVFCVLGALAAIGSTASAADCSGASAVPHEGNVTEVREAMLCLLNQERSAHGLEHIRANKRLGMAATRHSRDMVRRRYFDHVAPSGATLKSRARAARYITARASFYLAENIAFGAGSLATPRAIVESWMDSPGHRANVLSRSARDAGIGVAVGSPMGGDGATYTLACGRRG